MSSLKTQPAQVDSSVRDQNKREADRGGRSTVGSLKGYAVLGAAAFFLLAFVEWLDTGIGLTPHFFSIGERAIFSAYLSINLAVGVAVGVIVGVVAHAASFMKRGVERALAKTGFLERLHGLAAGVFVAGVVAILLNQVPQINRFIIGLIREAEKFPVLRDPLLNHERSSSYLLIMGLFISCALVWMMSRKSSLLSAPLRIIWLVMLASVIAAAYYVDSRVEVQLYEYTLHRSMFLLNIALAMAFAGSLYASSERLRYRSRSPRALLAAMAFCVAFIAATLFTFIHFGKNHNLKSLIFYRTTQAKQSYLLAWWALDFDRDGYSALLDGGDSDDGHAGINPGQIEIPGDGVDNNSLGGDLTTEAIDDWRGEHNALRRPPTQPARQFNVVYFFVDTVRADHLGAYGYHRATTPNIDKLAARSTVFLNGFSASPRTSESVPKFMQSSYWDARIESWTQALTRSGYDTMLFPGRRSWERYKAWMPIVHKSQGKKLKENIDVAIQTLSDRPADKPFCAYIYVPDPHRPYLKHDEFNYGSSITDLYDGELSYTDHHLGRFFDWMEQSGRLEDTVIVIMSDHGESLGERGVYRHSTQVHNEQMRVPMIVYVPGQQPRRVTDYVSSIDLGSTILDIVGIEYPKEYIGVSLLPLIRGERLVRPPIYGEQTSQDMSPYVRLDQQVHPETKKYMVITQDGLKLIYNRDFYSFEMYDLNNDPGEVRNLYGRIADKGDYLNRLMGRFVDVVTASRPPDADEGRYSRSGGVDGDKVEE